MEYEPPINTDIHELDTWRDIIQSEGWAYFRELLAEHKRSLEAQVVIAVKNKKYDIASDYVSRADECMKILQPVDVRLAELKKIGR